MTGLYIGEDLQDFGGECSPYILLVKFICPMKIVNVTKTNNE